MTLGTVRAHGDDILVRRAGLRVAAYATALVMLAMLALVAVVITLLMRGQSAATDRQLRSTVATADDVGDPPPGMWVVIARSGRVQRSSGLPVILNSRLGELRAIAGSTVQFVAVSAADNSKYLVATVVRPGDTVQAIVDLAAQREQRTRLLQSMGLATLCGLLFSALVGAAIGRRAVRPMAEALALQRAFIADASHELRTPLTLLSTRAQILDRAIEAGDARAEILSDSAGILRDVQRLDEVVDDLLAAADPRRDQERAPVDVVSLVSGVVDSAGAHAAARDVRIESRVNALAEAVVSGTAVALRRAILALVDNAIDHAPPGGAVVVSVHTDARRVVVRVSDSGPGVAASAAGDVFRRFHSGGQRSGRSHYGLGLALSHDIANRHGGHLRLIPGSGGAVFELALPHAKRTM